MYPSISRQASGDSGRIVQKIGKFSRRSFVVWLALAVPGGLLTAQKSKPDLSQTIVIGDSLSAGFQNGGLLGTQQVNGYAALIAAQAGVPLTLPLIASPGFPTALELVIGPAGPLIRPLPGDLPTPPRTNPSEQATNLAVPGHRLADALRTRPSDPVNPLTDMVLGIPGAPDGIPRSQVEWAELLAPTTVIVWLGNNDALGAITDLGQTNVDLSRLTPLANFARDFRELMQRLRATGAALVVANLPDVTRVPFLIPAADLAAQIGAPLYAIGPILGIRAGDSVTADSLPLVQQILEGQAAPPLPRKYVLSAGQATLIRTHVLAYNLVIAAQAAFHGATLVDIYSLVRDLDRYGYTVGGKKLTTKPLGGLFSVDGVHPSNTGYAIIANEFIKTLNRRWSLGIPPLDVLPVMLADPVIWPPVVSGLLQEAAVQ